MRIHLRDKSTIKPKAVDQNKVGIHAPHSHWTSFNHQSAFLTVAPAALEFTVVMTYHGTAAVIAAVSFLNVLQNVYIQSEGLGLQMSCSTQTPIILLGRSQMNTVFLWRAAKGKEVSYGSTFQTKTHKRKTHSKKWSVSPWDAHKHTQMSADLDSACLFLGKLDEVKTVPKVTASLGALCVCVVTCPEMTERYLFTLLFACRQSALFSIHLSPLPLDFLHPFVFFYPSWGSIPKPAPASADFFVSSSFIIFLFR